MEITKRVKIPTGLKCNIRCRFCYYGNKLTEENPPTKYIKSEMDYARRQGILDIDFSGGESTIRKDFPELVSYAKELGFRKICVITNGQRMANEDYTKRLIDAGLNEVLFSVHGHDIKMHDYLTQVPGSFERLMKAIDNIKEHGIKFRTNTTVTRPNYKYLSKYAELFLQLKPSAVNFILFNDWCFAKRRVDQMAARYSDAAPYLKKAIDILDPEIEKITVRYIPFCFMQRYEKHVCDYPQLKYDTDEWLPRVKDRLDCGPLRHWVNIIGRLIFYPPVNKLRERKFDELIDESFVKAYMNQTYTKNTDCKTCLYYFICNGLEKSYVEFFGFDTTPVPGEKIKDPMFYRKGYCN